MIVKKCIYCDGEIKPCEDFYKQNGEESYNKHVAAMKEMGIALSENYNCIKCGQMYDKYLNLLNGKLGWLGKK